MLTIFSPEMKSKSEEPSYYTDGEARHPFELLQGVGVAEVIVYVFAGVAHLANV